MEHDHIVIRPARQPRQDWEEKFSDMAQRGDEQWLDADVPSLTRWDDEEWEWR